jgi:DNA-binding NarL/FixJ family response regulator
MKTIQVTIFDDNKSRRELLQLLLDSTQGFACSGAFEDCRNVITNIEANMPNVVLMDIDMPYVNGIEGLTQIKARFPEVKIMMQTIFEDDEKIFSAISAGANGYILKKTPPAKLLEFIQEIMEGGAPMTPIIAKKVLELFHNQNRKTKVNNFNLSTRELEILQFLVKGYSYKMIANECYISYSTVNTHVTNIYEKLQVESVGGAVYKAMKEGLVK